MRFLAELSYISRYECKTLVGLAYETSKTHHYAFSCSTWVALMLCKVVAFSMSSPVAVASSPCPINQRLVLNNAYPGDVPTCSTLVDFALVQRSVKMAEEEQVVTEETEEEVGCTSLSASLSGPSV